MTFPHPAFPVVISAPSGAGKTTIARRLVEKHDNVVFSISATTRKPRQGEQDGRDYHFVDDVTFDQMIERGELAEWAVVHGRRYGTPRQEITTALDEGRTVVLDIDVQGARQVRDVFGNALGVFVLPPSADELVRRLSGRASEDPEERRRRLTNARREIEAVTEFDFVVVNDNLDRACARVESILRAEWARVERMRKLDAFAQELVDDLNRLINDEG